MAVTPADVGQPVRRLPGRHERRTDHRHEGNQVLDLAAEVGALLLVSEDADLTSMSPWRGVPILRATEFTARVDAMRRHQRRGTAR